MQDKRQIVIVDIDGVMADYAGDFVRWASCGEIELDSALQTTPRLNEILCVDEEQYNVLKHRWRSEHRKKHLTVYPGVQEAMKELWQRYYVVIITSRPVEEYAAIKNDTEFWLNFHANIPYDELLFTSNKFFEAEERFNLGRIAAVFDDIPEFLSPFARAGVPCFLIHHKYNENAMFKRRYNSLLDATSALIREREGDMSL